jgi:hypothetical protein
LHGITSGANAQLPDDPPLELATVGDSKGGGQQRGNLLFFGPRKR